MYHSRQKKHQTKAECFLHLMKGRLLTPKNYFKRGIDNIISMVVRISKLCFCYKVYT